MKARIEEQVAAYREDYKKYYEANATADSPRLRDSNPSVVIIPGLGLFGFGKNKKEARITTEFFINAIHVMAGASVLEDGAAPQPLPHARRVEQSGEFSSLHNYVALPRSEAFRIEYWALEEAKLQRMPPEAEFSRQIALVVGGGSGVGREVALLLAQKGAHVVVADIAAATAREGSAGSGCCCRRRSGCSDDRRLEFQAKPCRSHRLYRVAIRRHRHRGEHGGDLSSGRL